MHPGVAAGAKQFPLRKGRQIPGCVQARTLRLPAAMAAGVADTLWSFENLFEAVMEDGHAKAA
ncbi:MAG: hypothetical protein A2V98_20245 [Planctomycetes bacterium RBG_16_64_12]|nr:MAG: hypothetical protein A2V98_20245 [Planctomycetes bacterium RBG_16_64_12]